MVQIFLAHAKEDKAKVFELYDRLKHKGYKPWLDKKDLLGGQLWDDEIKKAIGSSDVFLACLSTRSVEKQGYVQKEFRMALQKCGNLPEGKIYLIPLRLDDCEIPNLRQREYGLNIRDYQWIDYFEDDGFEQLVRSIDYHFPKVDTAPDTSSNEVEKEEKSEPYLLDSPSEVPELPLPDEYGNLEPLMWSHPVEWSHPIEAASPAPQQPSQEVVVPTQEPDNVPRRRGRLVSKSKPRGTPRLKTLDLGNGITLELVYISAGTFPMGSPEEKGKDRERPQHKVTVPEFWMGKYPVTQAQYKVASGKNPSKFKDDNCPVETVSWHDAVKFCEQVSQKTGENFRLPSESEWEYACRAGATTPYCFGERLDIGQANYGKNIDKTTPVGDYPPNDFGLYDMHGNVYEWCYDDWHNNYNGAPTNGSAWKEGGNPNSRVLRGGCWYHSPWFCRSAYRDNDNPDDRDYSIGFRVVCSALSILQ
ncbi:MAG: SUMF1/EgtB/PvdO family nonheme iron enzyme [Cyanobacteria bacterium P01_H01_bin.105]